MTTMTKPKRNADKVRSPLEASDVNYGDAQMYTCVAFDQGGTTGWSVIGVYMDALRSDEYKILENIEFWSAGEFNGPEHKQVDAMLSLVYNWPSSHIVLEAWQNRQQAGGMEVFSPLRIMAAFQYGLHLHDERLTFIVQPQGLAMTTVTDDRQKDWGFWLPGSKDANDAIKHNLTWLRRAKEIMTVRTSKHPTGQL